MPHLHRTRHPPGHGPHYGQDHATAHDLNAAENHLEGLKRRYADTQTEVALSLALGRTFDQVRSPPSQTALAAATQPVMLLVCGGGGRCSDAALA